MTDESEAPKTSLVRLKTVRQRHAMDMAFRGLGGVAELQAWAAKNDENRKAFYGWWVSLAKKEATVQHNHDHRLLSPSERDARIKELLAAENRRLEAPEGKFEEIQEDTHHYTPVMVDRLLAPDGE